jgi:hypothetical protein
VPGCNVIVAVFADWVVSILDVSVTVAEDCPDEIVTCPAVPLSL